MSSRLSLEEGLPPLAARVGPVVREHEVLRIAATLHGKDTKQAADEARRQVLTWAQNRCGGKLPPDAWNFETFEYFAGGRNSLGVRLRTEGSDIWTIRADDPDKSVAGRVWTTEVVIGARPGQRARFSARLLVNTPEGDLEIEPHAPGLVQQVIDACGLSAGMDDVDYRPRLLRDETEANDLVELLLDAERTLPVIVLTGDERATEPDAPPLDADKLARAVVGMAHVAVVPADFTRLLTARLGTMRSVFHGGARFYLPGFSETADPFRHRLITGDRLANPMGRAQAVRWLRGMAAEESLRRNRLGRDVLAFNEIRNARLRARQNELATEGASESEQLKAAQVAISALEAQLDHELATQQYFDEEARKDRDRAETAEAQLRASNYYIQQLQARIRSKGEDVDEALPSPQSWADFGEWCDVHLAGRLTLAPAARRGAKDAQFEDLELIARCTQWLATTYRDGRLNGADGDFRDAVIEEGVRNSPCGGDEFEIDWQGRKHTADWHVKNGGNTREPRRCLRIYYFWEPETQQVVIADMPHHRRSVVS